ncbi:hypothetical protein [Microbacterium aurum]|uniref:hypothetical protein n=1 Tax=Microbacterium aurum TaxID=36805 RepID=UPI0028EC21DC|nr:hypothetical protein [Microbacterium aurum]
MTVVDARFAGGAIRVDDDDTSGVTPDGIVLVTIDAPGWDVAMFPHEARAFAAALLDAAGTAERRTTRLRRSPDVDDHLRELDD